jgi:hypothetical protein
MYDYRRHITAYIVRFKHCTGIASPGAYLAFEGFPSSLSALTPAARTCKNTSITRHQTQGPVGLWNAMKSARSPTATAWLGRSHLRPIGRFALLDGGIFCGDRQKSRSCAWRAIGPSLVKRGMYGPLEFNSIYISVSCMFFPFVSMSLHHFVI